MAIPTRSFTSTRQQHLDDHLLLHEFFNNWEGRLPNEFATVATLNALLASTNRYETVVGNGSTTDFSIQHLLGSLSVDVTARLTNFPYSQVVVDFDPVDVNTVTVQTVAPPTTNGYTITVRR